MMDSAKFVFFFTMLILFLNFTCKAISFVQGWVNTISDLNTSFTSWKLKYNTLMKHEKIYFNYILKVIFMLFNLMCRRKIKNCLNLNLFIFCVKKWAHCFNCTDFQQVTMEFLRCPHPSERMDKMIKIWIIKVNWKFWTNRMWII